MMSAPDPHSLLETKEEHEELRKAIRQLPDQMRFVLERIASGDTQQEVAAEIGRSPNRVYQIKNCALRKLRAALERRTSLFDDRLPRVSYLRADRKPVPVPEVVLTDHPKRPDPGAVHWVYHRTRHVWIGPFRSAAQAQAQYHPLNAVVMIGTPEAPPKVHYSATAH